MARQNPGRTALAPGASNLRMPAVTWSRYLGGALNSRQVVARDVDGVGEAEVLLLAGGRLLAKSSDDRVVWETTPYGLSDIVGLADLDGDGQLELIARGTSIVAVFSVRTGALRWRTDAASFGPSIGAVRMADFNGDGKLDLYVADASCGSVGQRPEVAWAYTFGRGFGTGVEDATTRLWQLARGRDYSCGVYDVVTDIDGDGRSEVLTFSSTQAWVYDGATGLKRSSGNDAAPVYGAYPLGFSVPYGVMTTEVADVDGDAGVEVVGFTNNSYDPSINSRSVLVLDWDDARPQAQRLYVRWRASVADLTADAHAYTDQSVADLNNDGHAEVFSAFRTGGVWTTSIYDGASGAVLRTLPGYPLGYWDLGAELGRVLAMEDSGLKGYSFTGPWSVDAGAPTPRFVLPGATPLSYTVTDRLRYASASSALLTVPDPDGVHRAFVTSQAGTLRAYSVTAATPRVVGESALPTGVTALAVAPQHGVVGALDGLLVARSDGYLVVTDSALAPLNLGSAELPSPGIRVGGFYSGGCGSIRAPVAADLGAGFDSVVTNESSGALLRLEAQGANRIVPPRTAWSARIGNSPLLWDIDGDGAREVLTDTSGTLRAWRSDGSTMVWSRTFNVAPEQSAGDLVPLRGPTLRLAMPTFNSSNGQGRVRALAARDGSPVWDGPARVTAGSGQGLVSAFDVDQDGTEDVTVALASTILFYEGAAGALLGNGPNTYLWTSLAVRGMAGATALLTSGGYYNVGGYAVTSTAGTWSMQPQWELVPPYPAGSFTYCSAAVVHCPRGLRAVHPRTNSPELVVVDAETGGMRSSAFLTGGRLFADLATASAAVGYVGEVGNATATDALASGQPAVLVGSSDGHLYAVDVCGDTPALLWALDFRAPVGEAVLADTDGDMSNELVVTVADGFLYGIDTQVLAAPAEVRDLDPTAAASGPDVDEVTSLGLAASWTAVAGATGYEWALFTHGGTAVTRRTGDPGNPFVPVDATTTHVTIYDGLSDGGQYFFAVRALSAAGASPETLSDGVLLHQQVAPRPDAGSEGGGTDGGAGTDAMAQRDGAGAMDASSASDGGGGGPARGACGCRTAGSRGGGGALALLALAGMATRRRRVSARP